MRAPTAAATITAMGFELDRGTPPLTDHLFRLASGAVTSQELVEHSLRAIEASQPSLHAFSEVLHRRALSEAASADQRRAAGDNAPLLGIPIAVTDDIDIADVPGRRGYRAAAATAAADSISVQRLRAAGAVIVGKTVTGEFGQQISTSDVDGNYARNPWNTGYPAGAAAGAAAAAVSAGLVAAAIGTDTAGGVRIAAAWNNIVGIKPERGRATPKHAEAYNGLTTRGVLARTVVDAAVVLDAVSGPDYNQHFARRVSEPPGQLRVAVSSRLAHNGVKIRTDPDIECTLQRASEILEALGHSVTKGNVDYGRRLWWDFNVRVNAGLYDRVCSTGGPSNLADRWNRLRFWMGFAVSQSALRQSLRTEARSRLRLGRIFDHVDVVITPTTTAPPMPISEYHSRNLEADRRAIAAASAATWPWNVVGWPALSVPMGFTTAGLPIGMQLLGPAGSEGLLISLATELEAFSGCSARFPQSSWHHHRVSTPLRREVTLPAELPPETADAAPAVDAASPDLPEQESLHLPSVFAAALDELQRWGIERFNVAALAERLGVAVETIESRWPSDEQLIIDAVNDHVDRRLTVVDTGSFRGDVTESLARFANYANSESGRGLLRSLVIGVAAWPTRGVRQRIWSNRVDVYRTIIDRARARGEIHDDVDAALLLQMTTGPIFLQALFSDDPVDTSELPAAVADIACRAVSSEALRLG